MQPSPTIKMLYVTPEQLAASEALKDILSRLTGRGKISLFVVDEVIHPIGLVRASHADADAEG